MSIDQYTLIEKLFDLRRDIVSDGYDNALGIISNMYPLIIHKYASGTKCWTWEIPDKWSCREAYVETLDGRRIIDNANSPLCIASYSNH